MEGKDVATVVSTMALKCSVKNFTTRSAIGVKNLVIYRHSADILLGKGIGNRFLRLSGIGQSQVGTIEKNAIVTLYAQYIQHCVKRKTSKMNQIYLKQVIWWKYAESYNI